MLRDLGILLARGTVGLAFASHGTQKAFGWFDGPGPQGAAGFMESLGFKPGARYATSSAYTELVSGVSLALGLGGPLAPAAIVSVMVVAQSSVHAKNGFFAQKGGIELGVLYVAAAVALVMGGYGRYSLDALLRLDEPLEDGVLVWAALGAGALAGLVALAQRQPPAIE
ncbi:MAG: DoxX family protein [Candidatus Eremiobacteraeota bacterium]|nr:DoxX family protein [Candidatus Eremiobacteraeota bacterium]